jgi:catechol 2,3-dioxygenase-like lactoylglutathione lyase family enzyme
VPISIQHSAFRNQHLFDTMSADPPHLGFHHVEVNVSDLAATEAFWGWLLPQIGYHPFQSWEEGRSWRCGAAYIVFVQTPEKHRGAEYHRSRTGLNHLAFRADSRETVDRLRDELRARGATLLYDDRYPYAGGRRHYALFVEDPDRIKVEIVAGG